MNVMRYTVVGDSATVSFVAGCESLPTLVAACAGNPRTVEQLMAFVARYEPKLAEYVACGLAVFAEHNVEGHSEAICSALKYCPPHEQPVFRVVDGETRRASLQPVKAGIVIFNLPARRIVQIHNTYAEIRRKGRVIVRDAVGKPRVFRYELPANWVIVP